MWPIKTPLLPAFGTRRPSRSAPGIGPVIEVEQILLNLRIVRRELDPSLEVPTIVVFVELAQRCCVTLVEDIA
jgi:hypothetical protein